MAVATLTISSKNCSSRPLRGWLLTGCRGFRSTRSSCRSPTRTTGRELLLLSPSVLVPRLSRRVMALPDMVEWVAAARAEPDEIEELDVEF